MPIRNKTITENTINLNETNQRVSNLENQVSSLQSGVHFIGEFSTYAEMILAIPTPSDSDWVFITSDETQAGARTQYIYDISLSSWKPAGGVTSVNDASTTVKGVIQLTGDLTGTANSPRLKSVITGGTYNFGNNIATVNTKGIITNIISGTTAYEWVFYSAPSVRPVKTRTLTVPTYDVSNAILAFYYNGFRIAEQNNFTRVNTTTISTNFDINVDDEILIQNEKFVGTIDSSIFINDNAIDTTTTYSSDKIESSYAKLDDDIIFKSNATYDIGSATYAVKDIYSFNSPIITSMRSKKKDIVDNKLGLEFTNAILPRMYKMKDGVREHSGYIADEILNTMNLFNVDFGLYIKDKNNNEALRYEELIPILCKAIQELTPWYKKIYYKIKMYFKKRKVVGENE